MELFMEVYSFSDKFILRDLSIDCLCTPDYSCIIRMRILINPSPKIWIYILQKNVLYNKMSLIGEIVYITPYNDPNKRYRVYVQSSKPNQLTVSANKSRHDSTYTIAYLDGRWRMEPNDIGSIQFEGSEPTASISNIGSRVILYDNSNAYTFYIHDILDKQITIADSDGNGYYLDYIDKWQLRDRPNVRLAFEGIPPIPFRPVEFVSSGRVIQMIPVLERTMDQMDDLTLINFCRSHVSEEICQDPNHEFWQNRLTNIWIGFDLNDKPPDQSYRNWYFSQEIQTLKQPNVQELQKAIKNGWLSVIRYFSYLGILPQTIVDMAAYSGQLKLIVWLSIERNPPVVPKINTANLAASGGHLNILEWLETTWKIRPNVEGANNAAGGGHIAILEWLNKRGIRANIRGAYYATIHGNRRSLDWLYINQREMFNDVRIDSVRFYLIVAAKDDVLEVVKFWSLFGLILSADDMNSIQKEAPNVYAWWLSKTSSK